MIRLKPAQKALPGFPSGVHPGHLLPSTKPLYETELGVAYVGDSLELMRKLPAGSVNVVITKKFRRRHAGAIPPNIIERGNNESNSEFVRTCAERGLKINPARFPPALPEFFIRFLTGPGDLVLDPFAGSNTTGFVAEGLARRWLAIEIEDGYLRTSALRFDIDLFK
jgi:DNA modification methylase